MNNQRGFSLVQVMVASAMLGGLALGVMHIMSNITTAQNMARIIEDKMSLGNEIRMILNNENFCRVSLVGNGPQGEPNNPIVFKKSDIDSLVDAIDVEFFISNQKGNKRSIKKFSGVDPIKSKYGRLKIKSIKLTMNNPIETEDEEKEDCGEDYCPSLLHSDIGLLQIILEETLGREKVRQTTLKYNLNVDMKTDQDNNTTFLSCNIQSSAKGRLYCQRIEKTCITSSGDTFKYKDIEFEGCLTKIKAPTNFTLVSGECYHKLGEDVEFGSVLLNGAKINNTQILCHCIPQKRFKVQCKAVAQVCQVI